MGQFILQTGWTFGWLVLVGVCGMIISEQAVRVLLKHVG